MRCFAFDYPEGGAGDDEKPEEDTAVDECFLMPAEGLFDWDCPEDFYGDGYGVADEECVTECEGADVAECADAVAPYGVAFDADVYAVMDDECVAGAGFGAEVAPGDAGELYGVCGEGAR